MDLKEKQIKTLVEKIYQDSIDAYASQFEDNVDISDKAVAINEIIDKMHVRGKQEIRDIVALIIGEKMYTAQCIKELIPMTVLVPTGDTNGHGYTLNAPVFIFPNGYYIGLHNSFISASNLTRKKNSLRLATKEEITALINKHFDLIVEKMNIMFM